MGEVFDDDVIGIYVYGSAIEGGLQPGSDLDLFVLSERPTDRAEKRRLIDGLLPISGRRAIAGPARSIELTIAVQSAVRPWRYPPLLDFQYGDWLRREFERDELPPWPMPSPDLAVLITTVLLGSRPLIGPPAVEVLDPVPAADLDRAMIDSIPDLLADLEPDTGNVLLTLARIWTTLGTGRDPVQGRGRRSGAVASARRASGRPRPSPGRLPRGRARRLGRCAASRPRPCGVRRAGDPRAGG